MLDLLWQPFAEFAFLRRALAGGVALALSIAPLGVFLMLRRMSLMGDAIAHGVLPGAALAHETFLGKGVTLLLGGMAIGYLAGPEGVAPLKPLFVDLFKGALALFLLEMGLIVARQCQDLRRHGLFLLGFALLMPLASAGLGLAVGKLMGLSLGGLTLLAILAASASYIAVPATLRIALPQANPGLSLSAVLGVTFPFNIMLGIPLYHSWARHFME